MAPKDITLLFALSLASPLMAGPVNATDSPTAVGVLPTNSYLYTCLIDNTIDATVHRNIFWATPTTPTATVADPSMSLPSANASVTLRPRSPNPGLDLNDWCPFSVTTSGALLMGTLSYAIYPNSTSSVVATQ